MAVSVRMENFLERELELAAQRRGISKSQFIIDAVERARVLSGRRGAVAQLGEHKAGSLGVRGSIPLSSTKKIQKGWLNIASLFYFLDEGDRTKGV